MRKRLILILQILVSLGLLIWLFQKQDLRDQIGRVVTQSNMGWLILGFLVAGFGNFLGIFRWGIIVKMLELPISQREVFRMGMVGLFFNSFLLGTIGGDAVKVVWLAARGCKKPAALMSVAMDRMSGIGALICCSLFFMLNRLDWLRQNPAIAGLIKVIFIYLITIGVLMIVSLFVAKNGVAQRIPAWGPGRTQMIEFETAYCQFIEHWRESLVASVVSVFMFLSYFLTFYCAARAFDVHLPILDFFAFMPTVDIVSALPVSLGGFGVREQLFTVLLKDLAGIDSARAILISLGGALLTMVWGLGGLIVLPSYRAATQESPVKSAF